ncbi:tol-pal system protein YbgF [Halomonas lysinitropha]|uniref:Cell division coordinator CpoB n=1 Tax=Halomonas lysinitropha TaxID=2607506 RepID=A0A5K1IAK2_9GAMM|nr:tol-pal system protein YbgF [Halomonas lysinitropha]VVZ97288.1 tol-pal system protein YbgF [Halomonas lysinitropha]
MRQGLKRLCGAGALLLPLTVATPLVAQQPVVEDLTGQSESGSFYDQAATREEAGGSLVLFNQVQKHQEELRQLRGQVEELRHQLEQLRRQTRQQYMDIEDRLMATSGGVDQAVPAVDEESARQVAEAPSPSAEEPGIQEAYQEAFSHVQAREFGQAISAFNAFVSEHPDSRLTANAHYWLGELHSAEGELEAADAAFRRVLDDFPESSKVPDALYKLGLLEARQGRPEESRALLDRVREEHPDSSAAGLADDFLRQAGN